VEAAASGADACGRGDGISGRREREERLRNDRLDKRGDDRFGGQVRARRLRPRPAPEPGYQRLGLPSRASTAHATALGTAGQAPSARDERERGHRGRLDGSAPMTAAARQRPPCRTRAARRAAAVPAAPSNAPFRDRPGVQRDWRERRPVVREARTVGHGRRAMTPAPGFTSRRGSRPAIPAMARTGAPVN
jgi:hypothetical protein